MQAFVCCSLIEDRCRVNCARHCPLNPPLPITHLSPTAPWPAVASYSLAVLLPNVEFVFGLAGSTASTLMVRLGGAAPGLPTAHALSCTDNVLGSCAAKAVLCAI